MLEATTEAHIRSAMQTAHRERAQAFADAWGWLRGLFRLRKPEFAIAAPATC